MKLTKFVLPIAVMTALATSAIAQLPQSRVLKMDVAHAIAQEAMSKCRADGYKVTVLVVDGLNAPKAMLRDDGATASTTEVAKMKATATMLYNRPSGPATPPPAGTAAPPATIPGTINAQGAVPIKVGDDVLERALREVMDLSPSGIRRHLDLNKPIYAKTSAYGHFGRKPGRDGSFSWEKTDLVSAIKAAVK